MDDPKPPPIPPPKAVKPPPAIPVAMPIEPAPLFPTEPAKRHHHMDEENGFEFWHLFAGVGGFVAVAIIIAVGGLPAVAAFAVLGALAIPGFICGEIAAGKDARQKGFAIGVVGAIIAAVGYAASPWWLLAIPASWLLSLLPDSRALCKACKEPVRRGATVCPHCRREIG